MANVLIIDDDPVMCAMLRRLIQGLGHKPKCAFSIDVGRKKIKSGANDVVLLDVGLPDGNGLNLLADIRRIACPPEVIVITAAGDKAGAEQAIRNGAWDYIEKPFSKRCMSQAITCAVEYRSSKLKSGAPFVLKRDNIIGNSYQMSECLGMLSQAAATDASVLITGESGTGKELFAKAVHENSLRKDKNFIVIDCAAIPETLVESLLFGYRKGAFTGADKDCDGLIKQADGGTLFLDEVGELPLSFQKVLLRVFQERKFRPIGSDREETSDFRLVTATNRNLQDMAARGEFRADLLFRLQAITIGIPPLRFRHDDIQDICIHYVIKFCERNNLGIKGFSSEFFDALYAYPWPGNVRELINAIEWAVSSAENAKVIFPKQLPQHIRIQIARSSFKDEQDNGDEHRRTGRYAKPFPKWREARKSHVFEAEKKYLNDLTQLAGSIKEACKLSGLARTQLYNLLKKHDLSLGKANSSPSREVPLNAADVQWAARQ